MIGCVLSGLQAWAVGIGEAIVRCRFGNWCVCGFGCVERVCVLQLPALLLYRTSAKQAVQCLACVECLTRLGLVLDSYLATLISRVEHYFLAPFSRRSIDPPQSADLTRSRSAGQCLQTSKYDLRLTHYARRYSVRITHCELRITHYALRMTDYINELPALRIANCAPRIEISRRRPATLVTCVATWCWPG